MLTVGFPSDVFGTNCYVVAPEAGAECIVIDPGIGVLDQLEAVLLEHKLKPNAVLISHGHLDHIFSVTPVCGAAGVPALIHHDDAYRMVDPIAGLRPELRQMLAQHFGREHTWQAPDEIRQFSDGADFEVGGLTLRAVHAPGHTEGSCMFTVDGAPAGVRIGGGANAVTPSRTVFSGDVLFKGSIGRTDLPGGSMPAMMKSLATQILPLPDDILVLPGHGPATTIGQERLSNPYLQEAAAW